LNVLCVVVYKSSLNEIKKSRNNEYEELNRLRQLYERTKNDFIEQTHQNQLLRDFYTEQDENCKQEQIEYFIRILNLFENHSLPKENMSLDEIRNHFDQQINYFLTIYKSLLIKNSKDKDKSISNDLEIILTKFRENFSHLFNDEIILIKEDETHNNPVLENLISFLNDLYKHINQILHEKKDLNEKLILLEKKNQKYFKLESKSSQSMNEDEHSSSNLNKLPNQMDGELDQFQELTNSRSTICSSSSPYSTIGKNSVRILFYYLKRKFLFFF
jgi:hypothetical protein